MLTQPSRQYTEPGVSTLALPAFTYPGTHAFSIALTGDIELDGSLHSHTSSREPHLTGEVGAVVLGPGAQGEHPGVGDSGVQVGYRSPHPGEDGGCPLFTGPGHRAGKVAGASRCQDLRDEDVRDVGQGWRGEETVGS